MSGKRGKPEQDSSRKEEEAFKKSKTTARTPSKDNKEEPEGVEMEEIKKNVNRHNARN